MCAARTPLDHCLGQVLQVATDVMSCQDANVPLLLCRLGNIMNCEDLNSYGLREVKNQIWRCDLIHVIIEVLRQDFSLIEGKWNTATQLVSILVTILAGFTPGTQMKAFSQSACVHGSSSVEQVQEYYEVLLPTAADSVLFLANNLLELQSVDTATNAHLEHFQSVLRSLNWLCTSHRQCMLRTLQSPYLLHILITDIADFYRAFMQTLQKLIKVDPVIISSLSEDILNSILDELVYKISGKEKQVGKPSLISLATFVACYPELMDVIVSRYKGLLSVITKWGMHDTNADVKLLVGQLEARSESQGDAEKISNAAVLIQATWRGYSTRKRMHRMQKGIRRFQKLYLERKAERSKRNKREAIVVDIQESRKVALQSSLRNFHEKQLRTIEQVPAAQIDTFVHKQESEAASKVQSWWRRKVSQKDYLQRQEFARRNASALVLQNTFRRFVEEKRRKLSASKAVIFPQISPTERQVYQSEIALHRELNPTVEMSELQSAKLHDEAQTLLEMFYESRLEEQRRQEKRTLLLSRLNRDCQLLLSASGLEDITPEAMNSFTSRSTSVSRMAETAHREELKAQELPWWKNLVADIEPLSL